MKGPGGRIDKRKHRRIKTQQFFVEYKIEGDNTLNRVEVIDLSTGGICFLRNSFIKEQDTVNIRFSFKDENIVLQGTVVRVDGREVGVRFTSREEKIDRFIALFNSAALGMTGSRFTGKLSFSNGDFNSGDLDNALNIHEKPGSRG